MAYDYDGMPAVRLGESIVGWFLFDTLRQGGG